jgi:hypothetical protein
MVQRKATFPAPLAVAAAALPAVWVGSALATGTPTGGVVHRYQVSDTAEPVGLTGAAGVYRTDNQDPQQPCEINVVELRQGDLALDLSSFRRGNRPLSVNETHCSSTSVVTGSVPIVPNSPLDTGAYKNVSGTFQAKATFAGVVTRLSDGTCDSDQTGNTSRGPDLIEATGVVSGSRG